MENKLCESLDALPVSAWDKSVVTQGVNLCVISSDLGSLDDLLWYCLVLTLSYMPQVVLVKKTNKQKQLIL